MAIKRMRKQCVPGALSPPPPHLGTRLTECRTIEGSAMLQHVSNVV